MHAVFEFVSSAFALDQCPHWSRTEVAVAGRSNVGKSSLLNAISGRDSLARTSKTPGRTRCLNFFAIGAKLALVDLPGYGYARMGRAEAARLGALMRDYLQTRANLSGLIILVDSRRGPEREELELSKLFGRANVEIIVAATKSDKLRRSERAAALERFTILGIDPVMCSASNGEGIEQLRRRILTVSAASLARQTIPD
jgi:GTP-binding protein